MDRTQLRDLFDMTGRVAVVTGGTRGIGRAIAEGYAAAGARVAVVSRNEQDCKDTADHLRSLGGDAAGFAADMGELDDVAAIVERTVSELGGLDVLVNNAGVGPMHTIGELDVDDWQQVFDVNVKGPVFLIEKALPHLKQSGRGAILNILSIAAFNDTSVFPVYASSKAALFAHTRSAAAALGQHGIRVNAIAPGPFDTELLRSQTPDPNAVGGMTILKRVAAPDEIVGPALMLTSDAGSFVTGQVVMVDGGFIVAR
jgi:NAD(P)-dependent dehydrogenase (short-subunit alcohol dehydrogenase family)